MGTHKPDLGCSVRQSRDFSKSSSFQDSSGAVGEALALSCRYMVIASGSKSSMVVFPAICAQIDYESGIHIEAVSLHLCI